LVTKNCATAALAAAAVLGIGISGAASAQPTDSLAPLETLATPASLPETKADPLAPLEEPSAEAPSADVTRLTQWVVSSSDNGDLPFMVIDKVGAEVFVFDASGQLLGKTAALLGSTAGDESSPGVGDRELSEISPEERTTPAGRFVAKFGYARGHERVLWVDYATSISLHPVVTGNKKQQRLKRLKSPSPGDNRITYGCINVPKDFYAKVVRPLFKDTTGVVYILPETKPLKEVFLAFRG
jgi:hypothetical protein